MEFERAIYRVYERCVDGLREEQGSTDQTNAKSCKFLELLSLMFACLSLVALLILHTTFVGSAGCLSNIIASQLNGTSKAVGVLNNDQILYISIENKFLPDDRMAYKNLRTDSDKMYNEGTKNYFNSMLDQTTRLNDTLNQINDFNNSDFAGTSLTYDYKFAFDAGVLMLPDNIINDHYFRSINISLTGNQCFGNLLSQSLIPLGGVDTILVNYLMNTFHKPGHVITYSGSYYHWTSADLFLYSNVPEWLQFKMYVLICSIFSFFFLSTVTAMLVRVLISSGVVILFPIIWLFQLFGANELNVRILSTSYPWIGLSLELIRMRQQSTMPFIIAHISRVIVYYFLYQATQLTFSLWFYNRDRPGQQELWIFAVMMLWEYYSMIYVRSKASIQLFPRISMCLFLIYHFYLYSYPSGFHVLALVVITFFLLYLMIYCVRQYETKAYELGQVSLDQPRMLYNELPWPAWRAALAPEFTLMMPVDVRSQSAYQTTIPTLHNTTTVTTTSRVNDGSENNNATTTSTSNNNVSSNNNNNNNSAATTTSTVAAETPGNQFSTTSSNASSTTSNNSTFWNMLFNRAAVSLRSSNSLDIDSVSNGGSNSSGGSNGDSDTTTTAASVVDEDWPIRRERGYNSNSNGGNSDSMMRMTADDDSIEGDVELGCPNRIASNNSIMRVFDNNNHFTTKNKSLYKMQLQQQPPTQQQYPKFHATKASTSDNLKHSHLPYSKLQAQSSKSNKIGSQEEENYDDEEDDIQEECMMNATSNNNISAENNNNNSILARGSSNGFTSSNSSRSNNLHHQQQQQSSHNIYTALPTTT